ncbi:MAG TPA: alpha/beta hydrolase [Aquabacterium sp.]|uniref:alpha/beta hydrolase n=1 Tax=Aquabacterium sp. TaxID=1872578 RepID=UPI002D8C8DE6|nr:alpha/beta hydrolase [Aquabacterium sp.]HET6787938.1 alpha/beta hydrolase [Aquabacterium sp.]HEX5372647.1 alpha/beta hydrolase [Aquabacterium sp.]
MAPTSLPPSPDEILSWPAHSGPVEVRVFRCDRPRPGDALLVFFHPGGFVVDDSDAADGCLSVLAQACGMDVLAPSYALAPAHPFPAAVEDAHAVLREAVARRTALGWKGKRLFVGGVEAGGNLAAVSSMVCRDRQGPELAGQILVMPMLDTCMLGNSMQCAAGQADQVELVASMARSYRSYLPHPADRQHPYASPLQARRLGQLPPAQIFYTEGDPLADDSRAYADKLRAAGNEVELVGLPPADVGDDEARCSITADDPCVTAMKRFLDAHR